MKRSLQKFGRIIVSPNVGNHVRFAAFLPQIVSSTPINRTFHSSTTFNRKKSDETEARIIGAAEWHYVPQVSVVNLSAKNGQPACYGIFWGDNDPMNVFKKCSPSRANIFYSSIDGVLLALRQAIHERKLEKVIVRTDSDYLIKCATVYLQYWRNNGYKKSNGEDVKHKEDLQDLDIMLSQIEAKFEKTQSPFEVFQKLKDISDIAVNVDKETAADLDIFDPAFTGNTIFVHGAFVERPTERGDIFKIGAYGVRFKGNESADFKDRMAKFPTPFRAQLYGILRALQVAKADGLKNVQVVTDSQFFVTFHKKGWKKNNGEIVANFDIYEPILKLSNELNASFRYLPQDSDNSDFRAAALLAEDGLGMPIIPVNHKSLGGGNRWMEKFFEDYEEELARTAEEWEGVPQIHAVKHFFNSNRRFGYAVFDQSSDNDGTSYSAKDNLLPGVVKLLIPILEKKIEEGATRLILRTDIKRLPLALKCFLKKWENNGYITAQGTDVQDANIYKEMSKLMNKIDLRIELFDKAEQELDSKACDYCNEQAKKSQHNSAID